MSPRTRSADRLRSAVGPDAADNYYRANRRLPGGGYHLGLGDQRAGTCSAEQPELRDLYLPSGGRIVTVDSASYERSEETSVLHLHELSLEPCIQHQFAIYYRWRSRMVSPEVLLMPDAQRHAEGQRTYAAALAEKLKAKGSGLTEKIARTVASGADLNLVAAEWSSLAKLVGARNLRQCTQDELPQVLRWLQAVERLLYRHA